MRPTLLNSCAHAATADEARFRIDGAIGGRSVVIVALDERAAEVVDRLAERPWGGARFFPSPDDPRLADELPEADVKAAAAIARACAERGIMAAGLILGERLDVASAVSALRPYARNLMVTGDEDDVAAVLTALRA